MSEGTNGIETLHPLEIRALRVFDRNPGMELNESQIKSEGGFEEGQERRAIELLKTRGMLVQTREIKDPVLQLTDFGRSQLEEGPLEARILELIPETGITQSEIREKPGLDPESVGPSVGTLKKLGLIDFHEGGLMTPVGNKGIGIGILRKTMELASEWTPIVILGGEVGEAGLKFVEEKSRKRGKGNALFSIKEKVERHYAATDSGRTAMAALKSSILTGDEITELTPDMLRTGSWKGRQFRKFNLGLSPPRVNVGRRHPYRVFLDGLKRKLTSLGFKEMRGSLTQPEFWNCDALYMPQFHSAREIHDIYMVKEPGYCDSAAEPFRSRVAAAHSCGGQTGSRGWGYEFDEKRSRRNLFRSHGTVLSARTLASGPDVPGKYFAVARCFRPDKVDATHAPDFFQIEGIVLGRDINFRTLLGLLKLFAVEIAKAPEIRFTPAYFPFTEPSVEVHMKHPVLGWTELGGAGIFRPEVTLPLGVSVPVIAWGLGIDRMAMMALGMNDIRDLFTRDLNRLRQSRMPVL